MKMTDEMMSKVNKNFKENNRFSQIQLNVASSIGGMSIYNDNWEVCKLEQLSDMIEELTAMKKAIEQETGIAF